MGLQQVGLTEEQSAANHYSAVVIRATVIKLRSAKFQVQSINLASWLGGRNSISPPAASPER
jgi:hypothetical protein